MKQMEPLKQEGGCFKPRAEVQYTAKGRVTTLPQAPLAQMCLGWKWEYKQKTEKILHLLIHAVFSQSLLSSITYILVGVKYTHFYSLQILVTSE